MRTSKNLTIITACTSIITIMIIIAIILSSLCDTNPYSYYYDISLALFGSSLLGFLMSLTEYFAARRTSMEMFWDESRKALNELRKYQYINLDAPAELILNCFSEERKNFYGNCVEGVNSYRDEDRAKKEFLSWGEVNGLCSLDDESYFVTEEFFDAKMDQYKKVFKKSFKNYLFISKIDLNQLGNAYGRLDFLFGNETIRKMAYREILEEIRLYRDLALKESPHFLLYFSGEGNFSVCAQKAYEINQKVFSRETVENIKPTTEAVYQKKFDTIQDKIEDFRSKIYFGEEPQYSEKTPVLGIDNMVPCGDEDK